jgi:hypothetical protein
MRMFHGLTAILLMVSMIFVTETLGQMQTPPPAGERPPPAAQSPPRAEKRVEGQVKSVNPSGTEITLTDGTRLVAPRGAALRPGVIAEGMTVVASYTEENGQKVLTDLAVKEPSASPPTEPRSPGTPSPTPPSSPKRY